MRAMTDTRHLAQFNTRDSIRSATRDARTVENVDRVNGLAEKVEGFVCGCKMRAAMR